jgi:hypothetical protein
MSRDDALNRKETAMSAPVVPRADRKIPPLRNGDHLTRDEFERRYNAMSDLKKAELIEGVVYLPSPVRTDVHGQPHALLVTWLGVYYAGTPGLVISDNGSVRLDERNEPQPDVTLLINRGETPSGLDEDGYIHGSPEFVAEVAASSVSIDRNAKFRAYQRNGVREYLLWRTEDDAIDWFVLRGDQFEQLQPGADGVIRSEVFPGLWLDPAALIRQDMAKVIAVLQQGLADPAHTAFVARLTPPASP